MDLVTDRAESDALLGNEKGVYGYDDLNRVESAVAEIAAVFPQLGISPGLVTKTDWGLPGDFNADSWPVSSQMMRYLGNVARIQTIFPLSVRLPSSMNNLDWQGANNIEEVLQTAFERINAMTQSYRYSGEIFAGEE